MCKHDIAVVCSHIVDKTEGEAVIHLRSDHRRVGQGNGHVVIPYRKEIPSDGGNPCGIGQVKEFIGA